MLTTSSVKWEIRYNEGGPVVAVLFPDGSVVEFYFTQDNEQQAPGEARATTTGAQYLPPKLAKSMRTGLGQGGSL